MGKIFSKQKKNDDDQSSNVDSKSTEGDLAEKPSSPSHSHIIHHHHCHHHHHYHHYSCSGNAMLNNLSNGAQTLEENQSTVSNGETLVHNDAEDKEERIYENDVDNNLDSALGSSLSSNAGLRDDQDAIYVTRLPSNDCVASGSSPHRSRGNSETVYSNIDNVRTETLLKVRALSISHGAPS